MLSASPGRLKSRRYPWGEIEQLVLTVNGVEEPLMARVRERVYAMSESAVGVAIDPSEVLVFAAPRE
jgi:hypothetical protein